MRQLGIQHHGAARGVGGRERAHHAIRFLGLEVLNLALALDDEPDGHALHAAGRERRLHLAPQHGRELEAHDAVQHAAGLLGVDEAHVEVAGRLDGVEYGRLRNLVEDDAARVLGLELEHFLQMPRYSLSLAVFIGREPDGLSLGRRAAQFVHDTLFVVGYLVDGLEVVVHIDAEVVFLQVAYVAVGRGDLVVAAQKLLDCLGLGRRLDDD